MNGSDDDPQFPNQNNGINTINTLPYNCIHPQDSTGLTLDLISIEDETSFGDNAHVRGVNENNEPNQSAFCVSLCSKGDHDGIEHLPTFDNSNISILQNTVDLHQRGYVHNTQHLYTEILRASCCASPRCRSDCCCCYTNNDDMCAVPHPLKHTQISQSEYSTALRHITGSTKLRQYTLWYNRFVHCGVFTTVFILLWCSSFVIWGTKGMNLEIGVTLFAVASISVVLVCYISCSCFRRKLNYTSKCALSKANQILLKYNVICTLGERGAVGGYCINLHFAHYDPGPCMERLHQVLSCALVRKHRKHKTTLCTKLRNMCTFRSQTEHMKPSVIEETDSMLVNTDIPQTRIQEFGKTLLDHYSHRYLSALITSSIRSPLYSRHVADKPCLCQYIEREFFHLPMDSIHTIS